MTHSREFDFGSARLYMDERSVHTGDPIRKPTATRSATLYVMNPGDMFQVGKLGPLQKRVKKAAEGVPGVSVGVVNLKSITLYDRSIRSMADGIEVATDFVNVFNEQYEQLQAALEEINSTTSSQ